MLLGGCSVKYIEGNIMEYFEASIVGWYRLLGEMYQLMVNTILYTPEVLVTNPETQRLWWIFVGVAMSVMSILTVIEGIRIVLGWSKANVMSMLGRTAVAFGALAFLLPGMTYGIHYLNKLVAWFMEIAHHGMEPNVYFSSMIGATVGGIDILASVIFFVLLLIYMFQILLYYGRRWFDIIVMAVISPLAFMSSIFDSTRHYFQKWLTHTTQLYMVQVVHAVYLTVIGLIVLAPATITGIDVGFIRILLLIGALWRMSKPPAFVQSMSGSPDSRSMVRDVYRQIRRVKRISIPTKK